MPATNRLFIKNIDSCRQFSHHKAGKKKKKAVCCTLEHFFRNSFEPLPLLAQLANRQQFTTLLAQLADRQQFTGYSKVSESPPNRKPLSATESSSEIVHRCSKSGLWGTTPGTVKHPAESGNLFETRTPFSVALHVFLERASPFHSLDKAVTLQAIRSLTHNSHSASEAVSRCFQHNFQGQEKGL